MKKILFFISFFALLNESTQAQQVVNNYKKEIELMLWNVDYQDHKYEGIAPGTGNMTSQNRAAFRRFLQGLVEKMNKQPIRERTKVIAQFRDNEKTIFCTGEITLNRKSNIDDLVNSIQLTINPTNCQITSAF